MTLWWSKWPLIYLVVYFLDFHIMLPWQPISVVGIAVAFYLGF